MTGHEVRRAVDRSTTRPLTTVWLVGDSLTSIKRPHKRPETGWGMPFAGLIASDVVVENRAVNGHSTQRFIDEGRWDELISEVRTGDFVLIQFGHNDESVSRYTYTTPQQFMANLGRFVADLRARRATPILLTPVARRMFDGDGNVQPTHQYSPFVTEVAAALQAPLLDMEPATRELIGAYGPDESRRLFLHLEAGEHPNYPDGIADDIHLNERGALLVAQLVLAQLRAMNIAWAIGGR